MSSETEGRESRIVKRLLPLSLIALLVALLTVTLAGAFSVETASFSGESYHFGSAGGNATSSSFELRSMITYEQGGNAHVETSSYLANAGWFVTVEGEQTGNATINSVDCSKDGANFIACEDLAYGDTIILIRANCTTDQGVINDVRFNLYNQQDDTHYINNLQQTYSAGDYHMLNTSYTIEDSGDWNLTVTCVGDPSGINFTAWLLPWGWLNASFLEPLLNSPVTKDSDFTVRTRVLCIGGECGAVNATLDPKDCEIIQTCTNTTTKMCSTTEEETCETVCPEGCEAAANCTGCEERCAMQEVESCWDVPFENCTSETICAEKDIIPDIEFTKFKIPKKVGYSEIFEAETTVKCISERCGKVTVGLDPIIIQPNIFKRFIRAIKDFFVNPSVTGLVTGELVPTEYDAEHPFYTLDPNPISDSCLADMRSGDECSYVWRINATGTPGVIGEFYMIGDASLVSESAGVLAAEAESKHIDVEIVDKTADDSHLSLGDSIIDEGVVVGVKTSDSPSFNAYLKDISRSESDVTITLYHDIDAEQDISVLGEVDYTLDKDSVSEEEEAEVTVQSEQGIMPRFVISIGNETDKEAFQFGKAIPKISSSSMISVLQDRADEKLDVRLVKGAESIELRGVDAPEIEADILTSDEPAVNTNIAFVKTIGIEDASITLEKTGDVSVILSCADDDFDPVSADCTGWAETSIPFFDGGTFITFTVSHLTAYAGGNLSANETGFLTAWDDNDQNMPNASYPKFAGDTIRFFADYRVSANGTSITDASCNLTIDGASYALPFNSTYGLYTTTKQLIVAGTYNYRINCLQAMYPAISVNDSITVQGSAAKSGAVSTVLGALPFYTTSANPQPCTPLRAGEECVNEWIVNATGLLGTTHEFFTDYNLTGNQAYVASNKTDSLYFTIASNDTSTPTIMSASIAPRLVAVGSDVSLYATAYDNEEVDYCWANVTRPDTSSAIVQDVCSAEKNFTTAQLGRHNVTFYANDSTGLVSAGSATWFETGIEFNFSIVSNISNGTKTAHLKLKHNPTQEIVVNETINGRYHKIVPYVVYDLNILAFDDELYIEFTNVNISEENNKTVKIDKTSNLALKHLVIYDISVNYTFTNATLKISYDSLGFSDEDNLNLLHCADWNFTSETCDGSWTDVTASAEKDTSTNMFTYYTASFSGFAVEQGAYCGDSACDAGETCGTCSDDCGACTTGGTTGGSGGGGGSGFETDCEPEWQCGDWTPCRPDNVRIRYCESLNKCFVESPVETESCDYYAEIDRESSPKPTEKPSDDAAAKESSEALGEALEGSANETGKDSSKILEIASDVKTSDMITFGGLLMILVAIVLMAIFVKKESYKKNAPDVPIPPAGKVDLETLVETKRHPKNKEKPEGKDEKDTTRSLRHAVKRSISRVKDKIRRK